MTPNQAPSEADWIDYLEGGMGEERRAAFDAWIAAHPEDAEELRDLHRLRADFVFLPQPPIEDAELDLARRRVMASLHGQVGQDLRPHPIRVRLLRQAWIPAAVAALFIGILLGRGGLWHAGPSSGPAAQDGVSESPRPIDGVVEAGAAGPPRQRQVDVQGLAVDAEHGVRILLKETSSYEINGNSTDRDVQNTLSYIVRNDHDPQRRQTAVQLLERHCEGADVCQILIYAMTQDPVAAVRREAALALQDDQQDPLVHQSFIKMLVEDPARDLRQLARGILATRSETAQPLGR